MDEILFLLVRIGIITLYVKKKNNKMKKKVAIFVDLLNIFWDQHGIYSMASYMKEHAIDVKYIGTRSFSKALAAIKQIQPDFVLYSAFSASLSKYIEFDRILKQQMRVTSVIGGPAVTYGWSDLDSSTIDMLCVGEGEYAIVDFINDGTSGKNIFFRCQKPSGSYYPMVDLDCLPLPDRSVIYERDSLLRNAPSKQFFSGRGCPYKCTYCFNHAFHEMFRGCGKIVRKKSVDYLFEEIRQVRKAYPLNSIIFNDDTFILDKKWFLEFCHRFPREISLPYTCNIRANLMDEDIARGLKESNCRNVNWSIESGNENIRNKLLLRNMSNDKILQASELLHKYGITFRIGNVIALPGESLSEMYQTLELNIRTRPYLGLANIFVPFVGLTLTKFAIEKGYYVPNKQNNLPKDYFTTSVLNYTDIEKRRIYGLMCLFPIFVRFPFLYCKQYLREILFAFPNAILRIIYEMVYTFKLSRMYVVKTPFLYKCQMAIRYLKNL